MVVVSQIYRYVGTANIEFDIGNYDVFAVCEVDADFVDGRVVAKDMSIVKVGIKRKFEDIWTESYIDLEKFGYLEFDGDSVVYTTTDNEGLINAISENFRVLEEGEGLWWKLKKEQHT